MFKKVRRITKNICKNIYNSIFNKPIGYIYMFHMVSPYEGKLDVIDELRVSPEYFKNFLQEQKEKLTFISIEDLPNVINKKVKLDKPFGIITFDDGYEDNFIYAYPILKELNIPFTIYVSVNLVDEGQPIWNYPLILEQIVRTNDELVLGNGQKYQCITKDEKNNVFRQLKALIFSFDYKTFHNDFTSTFVNYIDTTKFDRNMLSWNQIIELSQDDLCTIGSHTMSHCRLSIKDKDDLMYELKNSKDILSQKINKSVEHLAYPFGWITDVSEEAVNVAQEVGYKTAPHSFGGPIRKKNKDLFHLHRIMINE